MPTVTTTIPEAIAQFTRLGVVLAEARTAAVVKSAIKAQAILEGSIRIHTPYGDGEGEHLRDTTTSAAVPTGPESAVVSAWQTKTVPVGKDKTPVPLSKILRDGRKGGYFITPVNKKALFWEGAGHPVMRSPNPKNFPGGMPPGKPNPYAREAVDEALPTLVASINRIVADTMRAGVTEGLR